MGRPPRPQRPARSADAQDVSRIAPDPLAIILPALSALAAVTSIAAVNWVGQERTPAGPRGRRKVGLVLRDLESCTLGLQDIFRQLNRNPRLFAGEGPASGSPLKFGVHGPRIDAALARTYHQLMSDVASKLVLAAQNAYDVMCAVEDGEIQAPEPLFFGLGEQQERLNKLIQERANLKTLVQTGLDIAGIVQGLVAEFHKYKIEPA